MKKTLKLNRETMSVLNTQEMSRVAGRMGDGRCPAVDPSDHTVLLPNPEACSSFFMCSNGVPILQKCPEGLHFNTHLNVCDLPQSAGCELVHSHVFCTSLKKDCPPTQSCAGAASCIVCW